ncbi:peptidoglycan D,D-transpeptidase FtsI family protein [Nocardioides sp. LHG3406-4]|uniref:peptidoglycan D,D-transpeptidase FtsI family protein n=1 Tax=Nocardioides sp. LHG3406-4 TaxID=2804575 RepID=UPI003CF25E9E
MNKPIRAVSIFCMALFLALMVNATYVQYVDAGDLASDPNNRRVIAAAFSRERGAILVGRDAIAESVPSDDEYKFQRQYPKPLLYAPVTGAFSYFTQSGIERSQNDVLSGEDSRLFVTRLVDMFTNSEPKGGNVTLTLDPAAQQAAYDGLMGLPGPVEGAVVAIAPSSGKILAMVSVPSYDPNRLASHRFGEVADASNDLEDDEAEPLINRAISKRLPPGSTFKLVTAAAAIESGNYDADSKVPGGPTYQLPLTSGPTGLIDNEGRSCGTNRIPFVQAMENSCNTTFAALAVELGPDAMLEQAEKFGFNSQYLDDLGGQATSVFPEEADQAQVGQTGIGQFDVSATPLQMAMVAAAIGNGGSVMKPYIVDEVRSPNLQVLDKTGDRELSQAVSSTTASELTDLLVATVDTGTASPAAIPGIKVAGKTGTAQSGNPEVPPYAWFVSFAPADDPQVAVAVMIEKAGIERGEIAGGRLAGPIARSVMEAVINQ